MEQRGQFTFYRSYYEALKSLPKKEREPVLMAIIAYALDGESPELSGVGSAIFSLVKPTLDTGRKKAESGKQGGSKTKANDKQTAREKEKEREGEKEKEKENESYIPPNPQGGCASKPKASLSPLEAALEDFAKVRKAMKKPLTDKARELTLKELEKLAPGDDAAKIAILNQSIQRGWQGVFPLKEDAKPAKKESRVMDDTGRLMKMLGVEK